MMSRCPHGMYNGSIDGDPSPYCSGCFPPGPLAKSAGDYEFSYCGVCGSILNTHPEAENYCSNCTYEQLRLSWDPDFYDDPVPEDTALDVSGLYSKGSHAFRQSQETTCLLM